MTTERGAIDRKSSLSTLKQNDPESPSTADPSMPDAPSKSEPTKGDTSKSVEPSKLVEPSKSVEPSKLVEANRSVETGKSDEVRHAKETQSGNNSLSSSGTLGAGKKPPPTTTGGGSMTVETETVPAVPSVAMASAAAGINAGGASASNVSLRIKKSTDNVTRAAASRGRKKKASRLGTGSRAEIFAAKIASAVDEADSSDSDETFVYESNPPDHPSPASSQLNSAVANNQDGYNTLRPRFQQRNMSSSSISRNQFISPVATQPYQTHPVGKRTVSRPQVHPSALQSTSPIVTTTNTTGPPTNTLTNHAVVPPGGTATSSAEDSGHPDNESVDSTLEAFSRRPSGSGIVRPESPRRYGTSPQINRSPYLRPASSRYFNGKPDNWNRWRGTYLDDYDDIDGDVDEEDDDDYLEYAETTPLRQAGQSLRRSRKNGNVMVYSPHNYQRGRPPSRYFYFRLVLWMIIGIFCVLSVGFILGFVLATSKPLQNARIAGIFEVLVSDEVLAFDVAVEAVNPGFLAVEVFNVDLDIFAKSPYVRDDFDGDSEGDGAHTMLLGNVKHFSAPLTFEGGFFHQVVQRAVGDVRLNNPGKNTTGEEPGDGPRPTDTFSITLASLPTALTNSDQAYDDSYDPRPITTSTNDETNDVYNNAILGTRAKEDDGLDEGQRRWIKVSGHPFDLIVRGVMRYNLVLGRGQRTISVTKTVHVDPSVDDLVLID
ncbi:hypothetical protein TRVA0_042S01178 [Trichomonascus vanleenenianus]|uniref:Vac7p n=1 Tax=Trichomonascus vanleenenianus TaxID=2268995 RepID=UPI003ECB66E3